MCGIFFCLKLSTSGDLPPPSYLDQLREANANRGPDSHKTINRSCPPHSSSHPTAFDIEAFGAELQLRGRTPIVQPHEHDGDILCWNGEIFDGIPVLPEENDGVVLMNKLSNMDGVSDPTQHIVSTLSTIEGPYAMVFYHQASSSIFWARDPLGRRSLLVHEPTQEQPFFLLSSVAVGETPCFQDVLTNGIHCLDLSSISSDHLKFHEDLGVETISRQLSSPKGSGHSWDRIHPVNTELPPEDWTSIHDGGLAVVPEHLQKPVNEFIRQFDQAVERRVINIPKLSKSTQTAQIAILFSGGIDSAAVAFFANRHVPEHEPIDLLNVAFENPYKLRNQDGPTTGRGKQKRKAEQNGIPIATRLPFTVPDRVTGREEVEELRRLCPQRTWNFVEIDIPYEESQKARPIIEILMLPNRTVMDMSLAQALYFASRGRGELVTGVDRTPYTSTARVLLNGLGSDELLGGYGRHRSAYGTGGWEAVIRELQLELDRIPSRNLGRDDRVVASHGKEARHPFLDLNVVQYLGQLPVHIKLDPIAPLGLGDKMLLRLAMNQLGLTTASSRKKRAMQFGTHSARMEGQKSGEERHI